MCLRRGVKVCFLCSDEEHRGLRGAGKVMAMTGVVFLWGSSSGIE